MINKQVKQISIYKSSLFQISKKNELDHVLVIDHNITFLIVRDDSSVKLILTEGCYRILILAVWLAASLPVTSTYMYASVCINCIGQIMF